MNRVAIEIALHRARIWQLEAYSSLPPGLLDRPATRDEHDPSTWWTPKDHFAHSNHITHVVCMIIQHHVAGPVDMTNLGVGDLIALNDPATMASLPTMEDLVPVVHLNTHAMWEAHHEKSFDEVVAMGEGTRAEMLALLGSLTEEQLEAGVIPRGELRWSVAEQLEQLHRHDHLHWEWAMQGLADIAQPAVPA